MSESQFQDALGGVPKPYNDPQGRKTLDIGRVSQVYPHSNAIDVMLLAGGILRNVQVAGGVCGTTFGTSGLPAISGVRSPVAQGTEQVIYAVIGYLGHVTRPVCLGFLYPEITEMLFAEKDLVIERHQSGIYDLKDRAGNHEIVYPDGTYIKMGYNDAVRDLDGKDFDKQWTIPTKPPVQFTMHHSSGTKLQIAADGTVTLTAATINLGGPAGKSVVLDGDPVTVSVTTLDGTYEGTGTVASSATKVKAE